MISNAPIELSEQEVHGQSLVPFERQGRTQDKHQPIVYRVTPIGCDYELSTDIGPVERISQISDHRHGLITAAIASKQSGSTSEEMDVQS